ncbi:MAG: MmgE/PrpD family protein [Chloroflexota bacterium]
MHFTNFIHDLTYDNIPANVIHAAKRCLLDTLGVVITGRQTELANIVYDFAAIAFGGTASKLWLDGRSVSLPGAVFAHAMAADAVDMHDGYQITKGHAGVALVPTVLAFINDKHGNPVSGKELLTTLVVGYEIAIRTGITLHATTCDYHTSGAWNAVGCAAMYARRYQLTSEQTEHALGTAEFYGPRSQMMRCIDFPTMVKDGSGWGAMGGISAGMMAQAGFTGAPAITVDSAEAKQYWADLGEKWTLPDQYYKKYAVCYWAQPAIAATLELKEAHNLQPEQIETIEVATFHEATRLAMRRPTNTEEAQYSLPFPVAAALVHGQISYPEIAGDNLTHPLVMDLVDRVIMTEDDEYNRIFPNDRYCRVTITTKDGAKYISKPTIPPWTEKNPATDQELIDKFHFIAQQCLPKENVRNLETAVWQLESEENTAKMLRELQIK